MEIPSSDSGEGIAFGNELDCCEQTCPAKASARVEIKAVAVWYIRSPCRNIVDDTGEKAGREGPAQSASRM